MNVFMTGVPANQYVLQTWTANITLRQDSASVVLALPAENRLFLVGLWTSMERKALATSVAVWWVLGTTSDPAAAVCSHVIQFTAVRHPSGSSCLLHRENGRI